MYAAGVVTSRAVDVDKASAEEIRTRFEELKAEGLMREYTGGENVFYGAYIQSLNQLGFYTLFTEENCLPVRLSMNGEPMPEQLWQFADSEIFQNILRSMKIEVTAYIPTAEDLELEKDFEINASGVLYKYNGSASEIRLPKRVNGILVESMSSGLFNGNTAITKVVFPSGFPNVGQDAFAGCTNLMQVELAEGIKDIGGRAFDGCTALKEITLPSTLEHVGAYAFQGSGIETLHIPGSLKVIGNWAFAEMPELHEIYVEEGEEEIGECAFARVGQRGEAARNPDDLQWARLPEELAVKYADHIIDPAANPDYPWIVNLHLPSSIKKIGSMFLSNSSAVAIYMEGFTSVEALPDFSNDGSYSAFSGFPRVRQIYFTEETIKACGDQLDAYLMSLPDGQDWAWYDVGRSYYWTDVNYQEFMTAEELADL